MAVDLIATDAMFPDYRPGMDTDAYLRENNNYLFLLKESLNYTLHNLGVQNFNAKKLVKLADVITDPVMVALTGEDGALTAIQAEITGIRTMVGDVQGNISTLSQSVTGLESRVTSLSGQYSTLSQSVSGIGTSVTSISGDYISKSTASQTSSGFELKVYDSEHSNVLVTLDKTGVTVNRGAIRIKNNTGDEVFTADTDGNLTLTGTVDSSAVFGSVFVTCSKSDYYDAFNGIGTANFIQISDGMIKSFSGSVTNGFQCAAIGTSSYFSLDMNGVEKFRAAYDGTMGYATLGSSDALVLLGGATDISYDVGRIFLNLYTVEMTAPGAQYIRISSTGIAINSWVSAILISGNVEITGSLTVNGVVLG